METFNYWDEELTYCREEYNNAGLNERAVEIPIGQHFVANQPGTGLEVGNVLGHYGICGHTVVDRYEEGPCLNIDIFDYREPADWIVCISTLEHVRWDEEPREADGSLRALEHLLGLLRTGGKMLVTIPFGCQHFLDTDITNQRLPVTPVRQCTFLRSGDREWIQHPGAVYRRYALTSIWAEAVWVAEFEA